MKINIYIENNLQLIIFQNCRIFKMGKCLSLEKEESQINCYQGKTTQKPQRIVEGQKREEQMQLEVYIKNIQWDLLTIIESVLKDTCPTSETIDQVAQMLTGIISQLNDLDTKQSKKKIVDFFDEDICREIKESYNFYSKKEKFHYNKLLRAFKQKYKTESITQEEESRIYYHLLDNIDCLSSCHFQLKYSEELIDQIVELECVQKIVEGTGEKLNYTINELKKETERMKVMLQKTIQRYGSQLRALRYDLEDQSDYISAAEISKYACQYHENGIYFLIIYFKRSFESLASRGREVRQIEGAAQKVLGQLGGKYRPGQTLSNIEQYKESFDGLELKKDVQMNVHQFREGNKNAQLQQIMLKQARSAQILMDKLEKLIIECCLKNSLWSKVNLKLNPRKPNKKSMIRITEKMLFKKKPGGKDQPTRQEPLKTIEETLKQEEQGYKKRISQALDGKEKIEFTITDMLRGKCIFLTIDDILIAIANIKQFVSNHKETYEIVQIENRFKLENPISDFTLKIQINDKKGNRLIAELQLSLQSNFAIYNFAHKVYQFVRSQIFSKVKTLYNYFEEYQKQMVEIIVGELQNKNEFREEQRSNLLSYFQINTSKNTFTLQKSFYQKLKGGEKSLEQFLNRFKDVGPLITMVLNRNLDKIDNKDIERTQQQENIQLKEMMVLQLLKFWNPHTNIEGMKHYQDNQRNLCLYQMQNMRNKILKQGFQSQSKLIPQIYGQYSLENAKNLYLTRVNKDKKELIDIECDNGPSIFRSDSSYYRYALECFQKSEEKNEALELQCNFRLLAYEFKMRKATKKTLEELQDLSIKMKKHEKYLFALAIQLLKSQYYLIYEKNHELFREHYKTALQISKADGIPFSPAIINDIEYRIWKQEFRQSEGSVAKEQIFKDKLGKIISNFGAYMGYELILKLLTPLMQLISNLETQLLHFKPNKFQHIVSLRGLTEQESQIFLKMEFLGLRQLYISSGYRKLQESQLKELKGNEICLFLTKFKCHTLNLLSIEQQQITDEGVRTLCTVSWPQLDRLFLNQNNITDQGIKIISQARLPKLNKLSLLNNQITDEGIRILYRENWSQIQGLWLGGNKITRVGIQILSETNWPKLQILFLGDSKISNNEVKILTRGNWPNLQSLHLDNNLISDEGVQILSKANWPLLRQLSIYKNQIQNEYETRDILTDAFPNAFIHTRFS